MKREDVIYSHFTRLQVRFLCQFPSTFDLLDTKWPVRNVTVKADLNCIDELLNQKRDWRYFINLCGQDFPIKTNSEIVSLMKTLYPHNSIESILVPLDDPHYQRFVSDLYHN